MSKVLCFGEILIRQQAIGSSFFEKDQNMLKVFMGGSEANVASGLTQMGTSVAFCSAFPENALAEEIIERLEQLGITTDTSFRLGDRIGSYILLSANGLTKGEVIYDRKYSSFSQLMVEDINFDKLFDGIDWFHWTALTPALNESLAELMEEILIQAKRRNITVSVDLNYRNRLWQYGMEPIEVMPKLVEFCDVIMGNIWAANKMLGTPPISETLGRDTSAEIYYEEAKKSAAEVFEKYPACKHIAYTFRFMDNPTHNYFYGTYHSATTSAISAQFETNAVVDRIGSGDAFMAGLIHALKNTDHPQKIIDIATGAGYQKLFVEGDFGNGKFN